MLTATELAAMRATQATAMPDTCVVKRPQFTVSSTGGQTEGTPTTIATESCRVSVITREGLRLHAGRYANVPQYLFALEHDTLAVVGDYLVYNSETYVAIGQLEDGAWKTATRLVAART